jgi:class 3 adenylate cyclase
MAHTRLEGLAVEVDSPVGADGVERTSFGLPVGTVTFLLTDVEGSTRLWEAAPQAMRIVIARHYELLDVAIARHGGVRPVEQGEGDSVVAAFARASDAVAAATDVQRAFHREPWPEGVSLRVRIALHTGEALRRDEGNYFGLAVNRCARLRAIAHGGQTVVSRTTRDLSLDRLPEGVRLVDLGVHRLRDLGRPEQVFGVVHPELPAGFPPLRSLEAMPTNLPSELTSFGTGKSRRELATAPRASTTASALVDGQNVFVGREAALQRLLGALVAADGGGQVVLVTGEPGVGKTRLLRRFTELAGVPVAWGACPEHIVAPPLWPWEQILRAVSAHYPERPVPGPVAELLVASETAEVSDVAGAALRRFEAIKQYLIDGSDPLVVVLDDLHWADLASLRLFVYLTETPTTSRVLLVGSYRGHESAALAETLAALARAGVGRIELKGLDAEETQILVRAVAGREVSKHTTEWLWTRTEGNPFFLRELVNLLASEHRLDQPEVSPVPVPVREVVLHRIAQLSQTTAALLSLAAVAGRDFDIDVIAKAASVEVETALEAIDAAVAAGLVVEDQQRLGWFCFTHALVAEALYETTGRLHRIRRHRQIGTVAARAWAGQPERAAEIARHWLLSAELDPATAAQACAYAATAARVADARLAPDDAAESWRQALATAALAGDDVDRYPLLLGLVTSLYRAGNARDGLPVFVQAMEHALGEDDPHGVDISRLVTTVVAAIGESNWYPVAGGVNDARLVDVLERALSRLTDPVQRALLLALLAVARYYDDNPQRRVALSDQALGLARPATDTVALARVLQLRALALYGPDYPEQCLVAATELLSLAGLPPPLVAAARRHRVRSLALLGRISEAAAELDLFVPFVEQSGSPIYRMRLGWSRAGLQLLAGRWQEADTISRAIYNLHSGMSYGVEQGVAQVIRMMQRWEAAYLTGTGADLVDELRAAVEATGAPTLRSILTIALVEAGRPEEARALLRSLMPGPKDYRWLYTQCWSLLAAARLGDTEHVTRLRDQLLPYRRLTCVVFAAVVMSGSVAYFTGEAALALSDADAALADLAIAVEANEAMNALPWLALARDAINRAQRRRRAATKAQPT